MSKRRLSCPEADIIGIALVPLWCGRILEALGHRCIAH